MILFIDTETNGLFNFRLSPDHPTQPRIVQLAAVVASGPQQIEASALLLIRPDGWTVPPEAAAVHGITTVRCQRYGLPIGLAMGLMSAMAANCSQVVAHNLEFDRGMVAAEFSRLAAPDPLPAMQQYCTMAAATPILKLPGAYDYKWPKLAEAYRYFFGSELEGAHDAMADVVGCMKVYYEIERRVAESPAAQRTEAP
jgi:DNA polymerase-3 subunit epsilon